MKIRHALLLDGSCPPDEVRQALEREPEGAWVVVRWHRGFRVVWSLVSRESVTNAAKADVGELSELLRLDAGKTKTTVQLAALPEHASDGAGLVVLDGRRFFGIVEPRSPSDSTPPVRSRSRSLATTPVQRTAESLHSGKRRSMGATAMAAPSIDAYPHVSVPAEVRTQQSVILEIGLRATPQSGGRDASLKLELTEPVFELGIEVVAPDFECDEGWRHTLELRAEDPFAGRLELSLKATNLPPGIRSRPTAIEVHFSRAGVHCGVAVREVLIHDGTAELGEPEPAPPSAPMRIVEDGPKADLTIQLGWLKNNQASNELVWTFTTPHATVVLPKKAPRKPIGLGAPAFAKKVLSEITQTDGGPQLRIMLAGIGKQVSDAIPSEVWRVLRDVTAAVRKARGENAVPTLFLKSAECHVPWELAYVPEDTRIDSTRSPHLATQFVMGRWVLDAAGPPALPRIRVRDAAVVFGEYRNRPLPKAIEEARLLESYKAKSFTATEANVVALLEGDLPELDAGRTGIQILHFACHGEYGMSEEVSSTIVLNDGRTIAATTFRGASMPEKSRPFVFLNACQVGAANPVLGTYGGFAGSCIMAGCAALIAPLWSVNDGVALDIATRFYEHVLGKATPGPSDEPTITAGDAVYRMRKDPLAKIQVKVTQPDGSQSLEDRLTATPLAYVFYGHPALVFERA